MKGLDRMLNPTRILERLEKLRELDSKRGIFGASSHDYRLNPCLGEAAIKSVEDKYNTHLPENYRRADRRNLDVYT